MAAEDEPDTVPSESNIDTLVDAVITRVPPKPKRSYKDAPPLQKPQTPERMPTELALRISKRTTEKVRTQIVPTYDDRSVSYIECQNSECLGPAIWIYGDPNKIPLTRWETSYKALQSEWPGDRIPWCQCCYARDNRRVTLKGVWRNGYTRNVDDEQRFIGNGIKANPRYIRTLEREDAEEFWKSKE